MIDLTNDNFKDTIGSEVVLVDFWAPWCGPCKQLAPVLEQIDSELDIKVGKVNIDNFPEIANKFNVRGIPTLILFKDGVVNNTSVGFSDFKTIKKMVEDE